MPNGEELNLTVSAKQESQEETGRHRKARHGTARHKPFQVWHDQKIKNLKTFRPWRKINTQIFL